MPLSNGTRIGVYEVTGSLGAGGMGEVYRARDTKLDRDVALKVLPETFTADPDRLGRFEREAKLLASLNHPNIASIYGLEDSGGVQALVLELVEGPTLADRIAQGAIPLDEGLPIARQIAEALEAAHEAGVIHRDLKPANIKVREDGTVKVLDFGLAKAFQPDASDPNLSASPTISLTAAATQMGMVIGTAAYMSPEQAKGRPVDKRADIWAFGAVLFEMLTGRQAFPGEDLSETLATVIKSEPSWDRLPAEVPPRVVQVVHACLQKDRNERIRDIGDVRLVLRGMFETTDGLAASPLPAQRSPVLVGLAALVVGALLSGLAFTALGPPTGTAPSVYRLAIPVRDAPLVRTAGFGSSRELAVSSDGTTLVYVGRNAGGEDQLYRRRLDQGRSEPLNGTVGARNPFISPDGELVGFVTNEPVALRTVRMDGGSAETAVEPPTGIAGATWADDGTIIFCTSSSGLFRVPETGGTPEPVGVPDLPGCFAPSFIGGANAVLVTTDISRVYGIGEGPLALVDLRTTEVKLLDLVGSNPRYVQSGHVVYTTAARELWAVSFDARELRVTGAPVRMMQDVDAKGAGGANIDVSSDGRLLAFLEAGEGLDVRTLVWVDRQGGEEPLNAPPDRYGTPRVSPDGSQVAVAIDDQDGGRLWLWHQERLSPIAREATGVGGGSAVWTEPEGDGLVFKARSAAGNNLFWVAADNSGDPVQITESTHGQFPSSVAPDGSVVIFGETVSNGEGRDLYSVALSDDHTVTLLQRTEYNETDGAISPNGQWLAYLHNQSGSNEIYVRSFPEDSGPGQQVSRNGGRRPRWRRDGRELFYESDGTLMVVPVEPQSTFTPGQPAVLLDATDYLGDSTPGYDVSPDGRRFLMTKPLRPTVSEITAVVNWVEELKTRVPVD